MCVMLVSANLSRELKTRKESLQSGRTFLIEVRRISRREIP